MQPTPRAAAWVKSARGVLTQIDRDLFVEDRFDPATANRPFVLALSDAGELVIMREDHPVTGTQFVLEEFLQYAHAVVRVPIRNQELIDLHLARRLADHFLALGAPLRKVELPFPLPMVEIRQHWHSKLHHDARNRRLRSLIAGAFHDQAGMPRRHWRPRARIAAA